MPDSLPITNTNIAPDCQDNLKATIKLAISVGCNHFETARMYGTSEMQFVRALSELVEAGEVKREDFIFQTKLLPQSTEKEFEELWKASWKHCGKLVSFWGR